MTTLVSDETLGKVVRLVWERPILLADRAEIMNHVLEEQWASALDTARELLPPEDDAIAALDRANEEAAEEYNRRETEEWAAACGPLDDQEPSGTVPGKVTMSGEAVLLDGTRLDLSDPEAVKRAVEATQARDPILQTALGTMRERDDAHAREIEKRINESIQMPPGVSIRFETDLDRRVATTKQAMEMFAKSIAMLELQLDAQRAQHGDLVAELGELQGTHVPPPFKVDPIIVSPEVALDLMRVERDEARRERDEARAELAATKKKLQGVMYGRRKR